MTEPEAPEIRDGVIGARRPATKRVESCLLARPAGMTGGTARRAADVPLSPN